MKALVIAEAGVNHNGNLDMAKQLVAEAAKAGADYVKFQTFSAKALLVRSAPKAEYQRRATDSAESQQEMLARLELTRSDHEVLMRACSDHKVRFLSTAFDRESFDLLRSLGGMELIKIPSGDLTDLPLVRYVTQFGYPVLLSTGMATLGEIEATIEAIELAGTPRERITVLHCTTEYPTPMTEVNLQAMSHIGKALGVNVGYSDHTPGIEIPIAAVALGATVIEKHFTLDRRLPGPDHRASLEPAELTAMITAIRNVELAMGNGIKRPTESELKNRPIARKSIVASRAIASGEKFTDDNLTTKRPGTGVSPMSWDDVVGRTARRAFVADEAIEL